MKIKNLILLMFLTFLITGCFGPSTMKVASQDITTPTSATLKSFELPGTVLSETEKQLLDILRRTPRPQFPLKAGILIYRGYIKNDSIKEEDLKILIEDFNTKIINSGLVKKSNIIPESLLNYGSSLEDIRKLGARFQLDILFIISFSFENKIDNSISLNFWDSLVGSKWYRYSICKIEILCLDITTGIFLFSTKLSDKSQTILLDKDDPNFNSSLYNLKKEGATKALDLLSTKVIDELRLVKKEIESWSEASPDVKLNVSTPTPVSTPIMK